MAATILTQPIASSPGIPASTVGVATTNQLSRVSQATRMGAGQLGGSRVVTGSTNFSSTDDYVGVDTTGGNVALTLTKISEYRSAIYKTERTAGANTLTIIPNPNTNDLIDGASSLVVTKMVELRPTTNANWHAVVIGT